MAFCTKCGAKLEEGKQFCTSCGAKVEAQAQQSSVVDDIMKLNNTADTTADFDSADIEKNKVMAILAYIGILFLIPLLAAKDSKFARYHTNQGIVLFIVEFVLGIVIGIVGAIFSLIGLGIVAALLNLVIGVVSLVLMVIGILNAANGRAKELPVIGNVVIIK